MCNVDLDPMDTWRTKQRFCALKKKSGEPDKSFRDGISVVELIALLLNDDTVEMWLEDMRWSAGCAVCLHIPTKWAA